MRPRARKDGLVVADLPDEVLVYDLSRHKAHCLNTTAGQVFKLCDGETRVGEIARRLQRTLGAPADERLVWLALDRLGRAGLLEERLDPPAGVARYSRRELVRRVAVIGGLSVLLPAVTSIVAPTPVQAAATCVTDCATPLQPFGTLCSSTAPANCLCTCDGAGNCLGGC
jgi:Coenzyme PQQ synthesis protein D (PqqD)